MAHCPPEMLTDLAGVLDALHAWDGVVEKSRNVFYVKRQPFLHFHLAEGVRRRADVKSGGRWIPIELPRPLSVTRRAAFLREIRRRYRERFTAASS